MNLYFWFLNFYLWFLIFDYRYGFKLLNRIWKLSTFGGFTVFISFHHMSKIFNIINAAIFLFYSSKLIKFHLHLDKSVQKFRFGAVSSAFDKSQQYWCCWQVILAELDSKLFTCQSPSPQISNPTPFHSPRLSLSVSPSWTAFPDQMMRLSFS